MTSGFDEPSGYRKGSLSVLRTNFNSLQNWHKLIWNNQAIWDEGDDILLDIIQTPFCFGPAPESARHWHVVESAIYHGIAFLENICMSMQMVAAVRHLIRSFLPKVFYLRFLTSKWYHTRWQAFLTRLPIIDRDKSGLFIDVLHADSF